MDKQYETQISDARWWAYDIPGNVGWIMYITVMILSFTKQPVFMEIPLVRICMITAILPAVAMAVGIVELISERIQKLDRVLTKKRLYRGFGALTWGGFGGLVVSLNALFASLRAGCPLMDCKYFIMMAVGGILCALFAGLIFKSFHLQNREETPMAELNENTVQHTLCIPLWGRKIGAEVYPHIFPDHDAGRICRELGVDLSDKAMYRLQYAWINCVTRQYNLACEIEDYLIDHPNAIVVEMGAGLSCLRRQMNNITNRWYCLDMENVILLREKHIPKGELEENIICDLNDFSWFDKIPFDPMDGIVFTAGGLFYYFEKEQVRKLLRAMADHFPGGMITFDAVNALGLKGVKAEVSMAGNSTDSYFSLENPKEELESWSDRIVNVIEKDYMFGYLKDAYRPTWITKLFHKVMQVFHMSFMLHMEFKED